MSLSAALFLSPTVNRLANLTPVLPHLRMLLSLDRYSADGRRVRGFVNDRWIGGTGGVAECPSHAASPPVPESPAGATRSEMRAMIVSVALRLSDRNKRCTMVCCGGPNCSEQRSARRPRMASAVRRGSAASQRSMSARCASYPVAGRHKSYPSTASPEPRGYWDRAADRRGIARKGGVPANWPIKCGLAIPIRAF